MREGNNNNPRCVIVSRQTPIFKFKTNDSQYIHSSKSGEEHNMLDLSVVLSGSERILYIAAINQGFFIVHADMTISELEYSNEIWKIKKHEEFKSKQLEIKFIDGGEGNVWIVTKCNRLFNYGSDGIFKQRGKLLSEKVGVFTEASFGSSISADETRDITHFNCGRYHTCLVVNRKWAFGCGYSSFYQTGTNSSEDTDEFAPSLFNVGGIFQRELKHNIKDLSCGRYFSVILTDGSEVWVTGSNENNQTFATKSLHCYHKLDIFQNVLKAQACKLGYHSMIITGGEQIENPGRYALVANGWNDNCQLGIRKKDESETCNYVDLPEPLRQHDPEVANLELFLIFTRTFLRYKSKIYETDKKKVRVELQMPFEITFMDDVKIVGGSDFSMILATEKHSKEVKYFFKQLQGSFRNSQLSDIKIVVTNTAY